MACLPATVTSAFFIAVILLDLFNRDARRVPGHALFGVFAVLLVSFICERTNPGVAWVLILAPVLFLVLGYIVRLITSFDWKSYLTFGSTEPTSTTALPEPCPCCHYMPCHCRRPCGYRAQKVTPSYTDPKVIPEPIIPEPENQEEKPEKRPDEPAEKPCIKGTL